MVKTRMGLLDLRVQSTTLNSTLRGARVANVYDAHNGRTYILKLAVPPPRSHHDLTETPPPVSTTQTAWQKRLLLIESGVRLHVTHFDRDKDLPTGFCLKLRKHVRTRRLDAVRQLAGDRILDLVFSAAGEVAAHIIVECFSGGNVILTDGQYSILSVLRTFRPTTPGAAPIAVKERYPVENAREVSVPNFDNFVQTVRKAAEDVPNEQTLANAPTRAARRKLAARADPKKALAVVLCLEPAVVEHALLRAEAGPSLPALAADESMLKRMFDALREVDETLTHSIESGQPVKGYIVSSTVEDPVGGDQSKNRAKYEEFSPYLFEQYKERSWKEFPTFDEAADEFFSRLESERAEAAQAKREAAAYRRVDKLATELKGQVSVLENARDLSWERAQAIEGNIAEVEAAITVIRSAIAAAVPWDGLARMVSDEKKNGNPVAEIIHSLQLEKNEITLMLEDTFGVDDEQDEEGDEDDFDEDEDDDDEGDGENNDDEKVDTATRSGEDQPMSPRRQRGRFQPSSQTRKALLVSVDLSLGAHANARRHYEVRKSAAAKMEKAVEASDRTLKAASKRAATEASKIEAEAVAASIRARRKALWFEKFYWFISSENYLVVAGKDAQQNELLVNRYLGPADVYVHADLPGASSVIVKNQKRSGATTHGEIPRMTLEQAGTFAMCRSSAWDAKVVTSAWWVRASQVSKTAPSGMYLPTGSFMIRGKKNFLDPTQLVMGLAFIFKVDETCALAHRGERDVRGFEDDKESKEKETKPPLSRAGDSGGDSESADGDNDEKRDSSALAPPRMNDFNSSSDENATDVADEAIKVPAADDEVLSNSKDVIQQPKALDEISDNGPAQSTANKEEEKADSEIPKESNQNPDAPPDTVEPNPTKKAPRSNKKHLTAKERRALKSGKVKGNSAIESADQGGDQDTVEPLNAETRAKAKKAKSNAPLPRGKRHKLKKMKKYSDQDEEERKIALAVLGSRPLKEESKPDDPNEDQQDESKERQTEDQIGTGEDESSKKREKANERREVMRLMEEEGIVELENLEKESTTTLDMLTAIPQPTDIVQYALPMCAPYGALTNYRYRVKLMPGSTKRGKAYRSAMALFLKQAEKDLSQFKQERDAIRLSPENDGIHGMLGGVKIMAPGLAEAQKSLQKPKKGSSKKGSKQK